MHTTEDEDGELREADDKESFTQDISYAPLEHADRTCEEVEQNSRYVAE